MKRIKIIALILVLILSISIVLMACDKDNDEVIVNNEDTTYTIQYMDDSGLHKIEVKSGDLYSIEVLPQKTGYKFIGLYDAEVGGTQYVNSQGSAVSAFTDNKNIVLYPQFAANEYTLVLDYQGAAVTGERQLSVSYGSKLTNLPTNLTMQNKTFAGWYTKPDKQGVQVADQYGVIPGKDIVSERNFDLSDSDGYIYLYAGFKGEMYDVTFYFGDGIEPEIMQIEHGTLVTDVVPETRVNGNAVYVWSTVENDTEKEHVFAGRFTSDTVLYAVEFAPVIDFETYTDNKVTSMVLPAGSTMALPVAVKDGYKFDGWYFANGQKYETTTMPSESLTVYAKYMTMLSFNVRGGSEVSAVAAYPGKTVELPVPTKEGYVFAGWYTSSGDLFDGNTMPAESSTLYAYWYKANEKKILITEDTGYADNIIKYKNPKFRYTIDLKEHLSEVDWSKPVTITINSQAFIFHEGTDPYATKEHFWFYSRQMAEEQYLLDHTIINHANNGIDTAGKDMTWVNTITVPEGMVYIALSADMDGPYKYSAGWRMYDYYWTIYYPDTSKLY